MLTYRVGAAGQGSSAMGMARYYLSSEHVPALQRNLANYYSQAASLEAAALAMPDPNMHPLVADRLGIDPSRALTTIELANLFHGNRADGKPIEGKRPNKNSYIDLTFSAPKSLSVAIVFAPTERERDALLKAHRDAVDSIIAHISKQIGTASIGDNTGNKDAGRKREPAHIATIKVEHYTARPTYKLAKENGDTELIPLAAGDMQIHSHILVPNVAVTDAGRATSLHQNGLDQRVHEYGSLYQAMLAHNLRSLGVNVELDSATGLAFNERMARLTDVPRPITELFSKRTADGEAAAKKLADDMGVDLATMSPKDKAAWLGRAVNERRQKKEAGGGEYESWMQQARDTGYKHRSVLRPGQEKTLAPAQERLKQATAIALPLLAEQFERRAVLEGSIPRIAAAKGLIEAGIADASEVNAITAMMREQGVMQDGQRTEIKWAYDTEKRYARVTTQLSVDQENEAIGLLRSAAADKSVAIPQSVIDRAVARVVADAAAKGQTLDFTSPSGRDQLAFGTKLAQSGMAATGVGWAGTGKSVSLRIPIEAGKMVGREHIGIAVAWRQTEGLKDAGVRRTTRQWRAVNQTEFHDAGIDSVFAVKRFINEVKRGKLEVGPKTTVVVDEVGLVGTRQLLELARLRAEHGFQLLKIGDDMQCVPVEAGASVDLCRKAYGAENVPELSYNIRQTERDAETSKLWREGKAVEALARKDEDGTLRIVPGGYQEAIRATVDLWSERVMANRNQQGYSLGISVPTNADGRAIGEEILRRRRASGEVRHSDLLQVAARDQNENGETYNLTIAPGSRVRLFDRIYGQDSAGRRSIAGVNGSVVEILQADRSGMEVRKPSGKSCRIAWDDLRGSDRVGPVRLSYGDAVTINARQSDTLSEHITSMPSGSQGVTGFSLYTSDSRHRRKGYILTSQGAEKLELQNRWPLGDPRNRETDVAKVKAAVLENMARNLKRQDRKTLATDFVERNAVGLRSGSRYDSLPHVTSLHSTSHRVTPQHDTIATPHQRGPEFKPLNRADAVADFADALRREGFQLKSAPMMDGKWHREKVEGDRGNAKSGRYKAYDDGLPAGFIQNFKRGEGIRWRAERPLPAMTEADRQALTAKRDARAKQLSEELQVATARAQGRWEKGKRVEHHAYLTAKGILPDDAFRLDWRGNLMTGLVDGEGIVRNVQTIGPRGEKRFAPGAQVSGLFSLIGGIQQGRPVIIAEGVATAKTMNEATGMPVVVAYNAGNLAPVSKVIAGIAPNSRQIFAADNDWHLPLKDMPLENIGKEKAEAAARTVDGVVLLPSFDDAEMKSAKAATDWNDFASLYGRDRLRAEVERQLAGGVQTPGPETITQQQRDAARASSASFNIGYQPQPQINRDMGKEM